MTDSSSCRQFVQRLGVGRMKHIETKLLWIQEEVKKETLSITGVGTLLNVADLNTKKLTRNRRNFLMYLLGFVEEDENNGGYATVGEEEFNEFLRKKATAQQDEAGEKNTSTKPCGWCKPNTCSPPDGESSDTTEHVC